MLLEMKVPSPGESISEVEILDWLVQDGDYVEKDQSIAEIDSDKATLELPAEESGTIKILVESGEVVSVGDVVCTINTNDKNNKKKPVIDSAEKEINKQVKVKSERLSKSDLKITPLASAMANENKIDKEELQALNTKGKITKDDINEILDREKFKGERSTYRSKMSSLRKKV